MNSSVKTEIISYLGGFMVILCMVLVNFQLYLFDVKG
jgi:hypothetical protein